MRTALYGALDQIFAQAVDQNLDEKLLRLSVSQFANVYPMLITCMPRKAQLYLRMAFMVFLLSVDPLIDSIPASLPMVPSGSTQLSASGEPIQLFNKNCQEPRTC